MPQVQPVATIADPPQRPAAEEPFARTVSCGDNDDRHHQREQCETPSEQPNRVVLRSDHNCNSYHRRRRCKPPCSSTVAQRAIWQLPGAGGSGGADEQAVGPSTGIHVRIRGRQWVEQCDHEGDGCQCANERENASHPPVVLAATSEQPDEGRPDQVVLLFDGERPKVAQR